MEKQETIFEVIASSATFVVAGTEAFLENLRNDKSDSAQQVKMAKALKKRVILIIDSDLQPGQRDELRTFFNDFDTVQEIIFDPKTHSSDELVAELIRLRKELSV